MSLRTTIKHLRFIPSLKSADSPRFLSTTHHHHHHHHHNNNQNQIQTLIQDPYSLLKEDPIDICLSLWVKSFSQSSTTSFATYPNLTGFLSKFDLWVLAYQRSHAHATGNFPPRNAIHSNTLQSLLSLQQAVTRNKFHWNDRLHQYIRNPSEMSSSSRPLSKRKLQMILESDDPCFQDRVVQEVLLMVLEPIFEGRFSAKSHGFRPGRNPHTVIRTIRSNFAGYLWFVRGDLSELLDSVDPFVISDCFEKVVKDRRVLGLIKSALKGRVNRKLRTDNDDQEKNSTRNKKKMKTKPKKKKILNDNEPKPDPYWLRTFFNFAPDEASKVWV